MEFLPKSSRQEFHGLFDHIISKNRADNTKFNTNLTVQAVPASLKGHFLAAFQRRLRKKCKNLTVHIFLVLTETVHAIWSYKERWDFPRAGSSLFLPRFSGLTFLRFLGPFFIFSEIFASGFLYFLR